MKRDGVDRMKKLLLVIDYQHDFVADDGALSAGENAQAIEDNIISRIKAYEKAGQDVLCTLDTHDQADWKEKPESGNFPLHCAEGSSGWQLYGKLADMDLETITKTSFMLDQADIDWMVRQYDVIELAGVTTDINVLQNAVGLYNHAVNQGLKTRFVVCASCVAAFDDASHLYSLDYLQRILSFKLIETAEDKV